MPCEYGSDRVSDGIAVESAQRTRSRDRCAGQCRDESYARVLMLRGGVLVRVAVLLSGHVSFGDSGISHRGVCVQSVPSETKASISSFAFAECRICYPRIWDKSFILLN